MPWVPSHSGLGAHHFDVVPASRPASGLHMEGGSEPPPPPPAVLPPPALSPLLSSTAALIPASSRFCPPAPASAYRGAGRQGLEAAPEVPAPARSPGEEQRAPERPTQCPTRSSLPTSQHLTGSVPTAGPCVTYFGKHPTNVGREGGHESPGTTEAHTQASTGRRSLALSPLHGAGGGSTQRSHRGLGDRGWPAWVHSGHLTVWFEPRPHSQAA